MLEELQKRLGHQFRDISLLEQALVHPSYLNERNVERIYSNQRLEFFGDSVLSLAVSEYIFMNLKSYPEGKLTVLRAGVVCESSLAKMAEEIELGSYLMLGRGERMSGGDKRPSTLSDAMEAVIAAMYLDGGYECARDFILSHLKDEIEAYTKGTDDTDNYKSRLQEYAQAKGLRLSYVLEDESGPEHKKVFTVRAVLDDVSYEPAQGSSKKKAEQEAAKAALKKLLPH